MSSLSQTEVAKLEDKDLQLQYILGGLYPRGNYDCTILWACDINCYTLPVEKDEKFEKIKKFIEKHHIDNPSFIWLVRTYLQGGLEPYKDDRGLLVPELEEAIKDYHFSSYCDKEALRRNVDINDLFTITISEGISPTSIIYQFLKKYSLCMIDFIILAKSRYKGSRYFETPEFIQELIHILNEYNLWVDDSLDKAIKPTDHKKPFQKILKNFFNKN